MMGLPLVSSIRGKISKSVKRKNTMNWYQMTREDKTKRQNSRVAEDDSGQEHKPCEKSAGSKNLQSYFIPKVPFLQLVREILQKEHGEHHVQAGVVLALHKATKGSLIWHLEDTNLCAIHAKHVTILPHDMRAHDDSRGEILNRGY